MRRPLGIFCTSPSLKDMFGKVGFTVTEFEKLQALPVEDGGVRPLVLDGKLYCTAGWRTNKLYEYTDPGFTLVDTIVGLKDQSINSFGDVAYSLGNGTAFKIQSVDGKPVFTKIGESSSSLFKNYYNGNTFIVDGIPGYAGGVIAGKHSTAQNSVFLYREETDTWEKRESIFSGNRPSAGVFAKDSKLYSFNIHSFNGSSVEIYDIHTEEKSSIPVPYSGVSTLYYALRGFVYRDVFYIFLGNKFWTFNMRTNKYSDGDYGINTALSYPIGYSRCEVFNDEYIYCAVGDTATVARDLIRMPIVAP